jgi:BirA family biotin operon repressor/biotin-[acetyl-CoA-carboxylase] ligase
MTNDKSQITEEETLSVDAISGDLDTQFVAQRVIYFARVASTNDLAKQMADAGEPEGTLAIADEQTAGRGRLGRVWIVPPRTSILMSLILRPQIEAHQAARVTMAVSLGACDGIHAATGLEPQIKWPNDILLRGKKCGGILAESSTTGERVEHVIVGLGLNVNFAAATVDGIPADATTLANELGKPMPRVPLAQAILCAIERYYLKLCAGQNLRAQWIARLITLNQRVRAQTTWGMEEGLAEDFDEDGALLLRRADGSLVRLIAGDVTLSTH